ncbi:MAG TPA: hypothetical protein VGD58_08400, partial [Herpetosiphonaceae bacterium]
MDHTLQRSIYPAAGEDTTAVIADEAASAPGHLAQLPDPQWAIWRWVGLRSAGFSIDHLLALAAPEWAAVVDRYLELEAVAGQAQERALQVLREILEAPQPEERDPVVRAIQALKKGQPPKRAVPPAAEPAKSEGPTAEPAP